MKLTKKLEAEVLRFYKAYWEAYLRGEMKAFASMLDDDLTVFGTAVSEVFNNKKEALKFYKATVDQLVGKAQFRNRQISLQMVDNNVLLNEQCDFYILLEKKWTYYGHARVSAILKQTNTGWKVLHQHASFPDTRADEGEQVNTDKIKAENIQLRDAVRRRTEELENKNRELEIEAALEKVRSVAMGMKQPTDMHGICKIIAEQLEILGLQGVRNVQTAVFNKPGTVYLNYEYFPLSDKSIFTEVEYMLQPDVKAFAKKMLKASGTFYTKSFEGEQLKEWNRYQKKTNQFRDPRQQKAKGLHYYFFSIDNAALGISIFSELNKEEINVFKKFRNVFELAYKRFIDIQKAEAQTREAEIELALERVRARTMAMQKSDELAETSHLLFQQFETLGVRTEYFSIGIINEKEEVGEMYATIQGDSLLQKRRISIHEPIAFKKAYTAWKEKKKNFFLEITGKDLKTYNIYRNKIIGRKIFSERPKADDKWVILCAYFSSGLLSFASTVTPPTEILSLLERFAKVFDGTYTRFLDLQKAEAQAREAQIEAALERVRSKTMALHRSEELDTVIKTLYSELKRLDVSFSLCFIMIFDEQGGATWWIGSPDGDLFHEGFYVQYHTHPPHLAYLKGWEERQQKWEYWLGGQLKKDWDEFIFKQTGLSKLPPIIAQNMSSFDFAQLSASFENFGCITSGGPERLSEKSFDILSRFAKVFDQTYTRFLDLQKAEAQAREAQIEAALEKIRSHSLAMHNSTELRDVILVVLQKLQELGISMGKRTAGIFTFKAGVKDYYQWAASPSYSSIISFLTPHIDHPVQNDIWNAREGRIDFYAKSYSVEEKNSLFKYFFEHTVLKDLPEEDKITALAYEHYDVSIAFGKNSAVVIVSHSGKLLTKDETDILKRFAKVFEQAYVRFLDLQKAETQAREAQIEVAVERVRAKALAMHKSEDLHGVVVTLKKELTGLQIPEVAAVTLYLEHEDNQIRIVDLSDGGEKEDDPAHMKLDKILRHEDIDPDLWVWKIWNDNRNYFVVEVDEDDFKRVVKWLYTIDKEEAQMAEKIISEKSIKRAWLPTVKLLKGKLNIDLLQPPASEIESILLKMGAAFDLAYKRFLDLQKAEAQAREAQIEVALERVRARTMAMHKSEELLEVIKVVSEQLQQLKFNFDLAGFVTNYTENEFEFLLQFPGNGSLFKVKIPYTDNPIFTRGLEAWEKKADLFSDTLTYDEKNDWIEHFMRSSNLEWPSEERKNYVLNSKGMARSVAMMKQIALVISNYTVTPYSDEENNILKRFANVFEQSYTRFLDLQKAEAQGREAQIEAALEKVRSRSLAMHKAEELGEVAAVVFEKLRELGMPVNDGVALVTHIEGSKDQIEWMENPGMPSAMKIFQPYHEHKILADYWNAKNEGLEFIAPKYTAEQSKTFFKHIFENTDYKHTPQEIKDYCLAAESYSYFAAFQKNSSIFVNDFSDTILSQQEIEVLRRFSKVFEQAYVRFLDLQKAEEQAREAEIQLALERIRAQTMAMQRSDELLKVITVFSDQLANLGIKFDNVSFGVNILEDDFQFWLSATGQPQPIKIHVPYMDNPAPNRVRAAQKGGLKFFADVLNKEENRTWTQHLIDNSDLKFYPDKVKNFILDSPGYARSTFILQNINLYVGNYRCVPYSDEENEIFNRFSQAFEQSYIRFLDLQKAEEQAREAQIQLALERVRARTMAMHHSDELAEVVKLLYREFDTLKLSNESTDIEIGLIDEETGIAKVWAHLYLSDGSISTFSFPFAHFDEINKEFTTWKSTPIEKRIELFITTEFSSDLWEKFKKLASDVPELADMFNSLIEANITKWVTHNAYFSHGLLTLQGTEHYSQETQEIQKRFAKVFEQTYTRFLDLKKVEAQAREAQIEAGLERVRSRTIAMHRSEEIADIVGRIFTELKQLDLVLNRVLIWTFNDNEKYVSWWSSNPEIESNAESYRVDYNDHPVFLSFLHAWQQRKPLHLYTLSGDNKKTWEDHLFSNTELSEMPAAVRSGMRSEGTIFTTSVISDYGLMMVGSFESLSQANIDIIERFGRVFQQSYTRYIDVQKAEALAKESQIEAALERVRSRTMAMHKSEELPEAATLLYHQLQILEMPAFAAGYCIWEQDKQAITLWMSSEGVLQPPFTAPTTEDELFIQMRKGYEDGRSLHVVEMGGEELVGHYQYMRTLPVVGDIFDSILEAGHPLPVFQVMHYAYFSKGFLLIITYEPVPDAHAIFKRFAAVFEQTYTRFLDLQHKEMQAVRLKEEKEKLEVTLGELQATQKQLIQSEKMASLGELTAGIAHEIQNPLNFVNNFSEVSNELIEEMKEELAKGNWQSANEIAEDVKQNLEKINHHGKRADGIVKGMLQHSRTSSGQKEPTDINGLAEEYLRLAYHGLRAKDKSFNAKFETDFDPGIEKINVAPQDIGRVILNLINNAFYAVDEKKRQVQNGYEPIVTINTRKLHDTIEIAVKDNGNGIPKKVLDKIFQPFFTTKPTGQGTGLGLSLAYDIIKSHGGELKVATEEGKGASFIISIPLIDKR